MKIEWRKDSWNKEWLDGFVNNTKLFSIHRNMGECYLYVVAGYANARYTCHSERLHDMKRRAQRIADAFDQALKGESQ